VIQLSSLTGPELAQLVDAFDLLNSEFDMLIERGILNEGDGVDINELYLTVFEEDERRAVIDFSADMRHLKREAYIEQITRPDEQIGISPVDDGLDYLGGLAG
jgi:hypothetical protein